MGFDEQGVCPAVAERDVAVEDQDRPGGTTGVRCEVTPRSRYRLDVVFVLEAAESALTGRELLGDERDEDVSILDAPECMSGGEPR